MLLVVVETWCDCETCESCWHLVAVLVNAGRDHCHASRQVAVVVVAVVVAVVVVVDWAVGVAKASALVAGCEVYQHVVDG